MRRLNDEHGAIAIFVAICLVLTVGMGAFVIDVAAMYQERRELQNGADAAALAIAEDCLELVTDDDPGTLCTLPDAGTTAVTYAAVNAADDASDAAVATDDWDPASRATVKTTTRRPDGTTAISFVFEPVLDIIGGKDADGRSISASATAIWGPASAVNAIPLTIAEDEYEKCDAEFGEGAYVTLFFHDGNPTSSCPTSPDDKGKPEAPPGNPDAGDKGKGKPTTTTTEAPSTTTTTTPAGQDGPGNFGWLEVAGEDGCLAFLDLEGETAGRYAGDNANVAPKSCDPDEFDDLLDMEAVALPVYRATTGNGFNFTYTLVGFFGFELEAYRLGGGPEWNRGTPAPCKGDERCIAGVFTGFTAYDAQVGDGANYGITAVELIK